MDKRIKKLWCDALESGEYKQGTGLLRDPRNNFCCLGVLCNLHAMEHPEIAAAQQYAGSYLGESAVLPTEVMLWAGLAVSYGADVHTDSNGFSCLPDHNDSGVTFKELAAAIREQL